MTIACVSEYVNVKLIQTPNGGMAQCPEGPPLAVQYVDYTAGAAATTNALNAKTRFVRVQVDSVCARKWASSPTAQTTDERMSADQTEYLGVPPDHGSGAANSGTVAYKLGFITRT